MFNLDLCEVVMPRNVELSKYVGVGVGVGAGEGGGGGGKCADGMGIIKG